MNLMTLDEVLFAVDTR